MKRTAAAVLAAVLAPAVALLRLGAGGAWGTRRRRSSGTEIVPVGPTESLGPQNRVAFGGTGTPTRITTDTPHPGCASVKWDCAPSTYGGTPPIWNSRADMQEQERRAKQRFPVQLPVVIRSVPSEIHGVSRDVSAVGVFFYTDNWPSGFSPIEFRMIFPAEITGTEPTRVVCKGTVVRVEAGPQAKTGVATTIESYTFS